MVQDPAHAIKDANFPVDAYGATYHVGIRPGQIANRILTVGDPARLAKIANLFDSSPKPFQLTSRRGFVTLTGRYRGVPVSVMAIGMGIANMDFFVREARAVVEGDLAIIRLGSCGTLDDEILKVGDVNVPERALSVTTDYDYWHRGERGRSTGFVNQDVAGSRSSAYRISQPVAADQELRQKVSSESDSPTIQRSLLIPKCSGPIPQLIDSLRESLSGPEDQGRLVPTDLHASADGFYASQGRSDPNFDDANEHLIADLASKRIGVQSLEMETAHLFHLAHIATSKKGKIHVAASHMIFTGRTGQSAGAFIDGDLVERLEPITGRAALEALIAFEIKEPHPVKNSVWQMESARGNGWGVE
ncbi:BZ3500_MvSof-1268-A1-R1_Chr1-1g00864 [Microbotryum saponariae]|uniref:BZ3500_MvSof-1268-A1-R1_Chr1-1g00864 protein n=1 Tax=Microbotryum saponariae TaxID=289078 RepID=A0A2X0KN91_9BASI|nr:BZ3500_MvSof-1268-A1-R1_Chr1-1g00864 [Microbotryum saponariae]SCZ92806.1 BZ3501_MvSof-1269-A2-R1_Chr1-1g00461 [Microbotryum saponariae]